VDLEPPVLLDFGSGTLHRLARLGGPLDRIGAVLVSHLHPDHYADLLGYLHSQLRLEEGRGPLRIYGPPGIAEAVDHLRASTPSLAELPFELRVTTVHREPFEVAGARVTPFEVVHSKRLTALGYRLAVGGRVLVYSGDSTVCPALERGCAGADGAILEATFPPGRAHPSHMDGAEACALAGRAGVRRLLLSHLSPAWGMADPAAACAGLFGGELRAAADLASFEL
jgi:ribonuclease BN (tRNA processing enzyme)